MKNRPCIDVSEILDEILNGYGYNKYGDIDYCLSDSLNNHSELQSYCSEINEIKRLIKLLTDFENDFLNYLKDKCDIKNLKLIKPGKKLKKILEEANYIINFNYTNVIEEVYKIKDVKHIHGTISEKNIAIGSGSLEKFKKSMIDSIYPTEISCYNKYDFQEKMKYLCEDNDGGLHDDPQIKSFFYVTRR